MDTSEPIRASDVQLVTDDFTNVESLRKEEADLRAELVKLGRSRVSGRKLQGRQSALRAALKNVERARLAAERAESNRRQARAAALEQWPSPSDRTDELAGPDYWPGPDDPFAELDASDTRGFRDRWRAVVEGSPPWPAAS